MSPSIPLLCSQPVPSLAAILSQRTQPNWPEAGLGADKAVQRETSPHHIVLVYQSTQWSLLLPKASQGADPPCGQEAGEGPFAAGWEGTTRGNALWAPAAERMVLHGRT